MAGAPPSITIDGDIGTITSTTEAYIINYQSVTSHGNEAVSDAKYKTAITHNPEDVVLTPFAYDAHDSEKQKGVVHVPIHNPVLTTKPLYLRDIYVKFSTSNDAFVNAVTLYYDSTLVATVSNRKTATYYIQFNDDEAKKYAYDPPKGISVALDLRFPNSDSSINLISVALVYQVSS